MPHQPQALPPDPAVLRLHRDAPGGKNPGRRPGLPGGVHRILPHPQVQGGGGGVSERLREVRQGGAGQGAAEKHRPVRPGHPTSWASAPGTTSAGYSRRWRAAPPSSTGRSAPSTEHAGQRRPSPAGDGRRFALFQVLLNDCVAGLRFLLGDALLYVHHALLG